MPIRHEPVEPTQVKQWSPLLVYRRFVTSLLGGLTVGFFVYLAMPKRHLAAYTADFSKVPDDVSLYGMHGEFLWRAVPEYAYTWEFMGMDMQDPILVQFFDWMAWWLTSFSVLAILGGSAVATGLFLYLVRRRGRRPAPPTKRVVDSDAGTSWGRGNT